MPQLLIIEPASPIQVSGGYRYNAQLAGALRARGEGDVLRTNTPEQILKYPGCCALLDSLWFTTPPPADFQRRLQASGISLFLLGHYFPPSNPVLCIQEKNHWLACLRKWIPLAEAIVITGQRALTDWSGLVSPDRVHVAPPAIDIRAKTESSFEQGLRLLTIGAVTEAKLPLALLQHLACLSDAQFQWKIAGSSTKDPDHYKACLAAVDHAGIADRVRFVGELEHQQILDELLLADVYLAASQFESFGIASAEALSAGLPLIGFDAGDLPLWAPNQPGCLIIQQGRFAEFAAVVKRWIHGGRAALPPKSQPCLFETSWDAVAGRVLDAVRR
ncbi:MAG: glycosyltransferase family 4 protein [Pseudomonadota bacterium]